MSSRHSQISLTSKIAIFADFYLVQLGARGFRKSRKHFYFLIFRKFGYFVIIWNILIVWVGTQTHIMSIFDGGSGFNLTSGIHCDTNKRIIYVYLLYWGWNFLIKFFGKNATRTRKNGNYLRFSFSFNNEKYR